MAEIRDKHCACMAHCLSCPIRVLAVRCDARMEGICFVKPTTSTRATGKISLINSPVFSYTQKLVYNIIMHEHLLLPLSKNIITTFGEKGWRL